MDEKLICNPALATGMCHPSRGCREHKSRQTETALLYSGLADGTREPCWLTSHPRRLRSAANHVQDHLCHRSKQTSKRKQKQKTRAVANHTGQSLSKGGAA